VGFKRPLQLFTALTIKITAYENLRFATIFLLKKSLRSDRKISLWSISLLGIFKIA